jgi:hypothetical protein
MRVPQLVKYIRGRRPPIFSYFPIFLLGLPFFLFFPVFSFFFTHSLPVFSFFSPIPCLFFPIFLAFTSRTLPMHFFNVRKKHVTIFMFSSDICRAKRANMKGLANDAVLNRTFQHDSCEIFLNCALISYHLQVSTEVLPIEKSALEFAYHSISSGFRHRGALAALYTAGPQHSKQVRCAGPAYARPSADQYSRTCV